MYDINKLENVNENFVLDWSLWSRPAIKATHQALLATKIAGKPL